MEKKVIKLLLALECPTHYMGFNCLIIAIMEVMKDNTYLNAIIRRLYKRVAEKTDKTPMQVERVIRHAIEGMDYKKSKLYVELFKGERPTNAEFIARCAFKLKSGI